MATIAKGNIQEQYVPVDSTYTFTPGSGGTVRFDCSSPVGADRPSGRLIYAAETITIPGGSTFVAEAVGADATSTGAPVSGGGNSVRDEEWRQVATRTFVPDTFNAGFTASMNRSTHIMRDQVSELKLVFPNWYVGIAAGPMDGSETGLGTAATIYASIEYPAGTFTQVTFDGATGGVAADGAEVTSDPIAVSIPWGATFYVRTYYTNPSGILTKTINPLTTGDGWRTTGATDQTMGGTVTAAGAVYGPIAILGVTSQGSPAFIGDSLIAGQDDTGDDTTDVGLFARIVGSARPYMNLGVPGDKAAWFATPAKSARRVALAKLYATQVWGDHAVNDLNSGDLAAVILGYIASIRALFAGMPYFHSTPTPTTQSTSTDSFTSVSGQTVRTTSAARLQLLHMLRHRAISTLSGIINIAEACESPINAAGTYVGNSGLWDVGAAARTMSSGDGTINSGSNSFSSAAAPFTAGDTGSVIQIPGAGAAGASLIGRMTYVSATTVTLTALHGTSNQNAGTSVTTANAKIGCDPATKDGLHPLQGRYRIIASRCAGAVALVV